MARSSAEILEFDRLRELLRLRTTSPIGSRAVSSLGYRTDRARLEREFAAIAEAIAYLRQGNEIGFGGLADPGEWLPRLEKPGEVLTPQELLNAATLADAAAWLRQLLKEDEKEYPLLAERARSLGDFRELATAIRRAVLPNGEVSDDASPALRRIRNEKARTRDTIEKSLEKILRARGNAPGEDYVTRRNDRYVIPVRASERHGVDGVMHAASASGQTVFVEPFETIGHNNRLVQLAEEETAEIARILEELTGKLVAEHGPLESAAETIAAFDSLFARARFARDFDACIPEFADTAMISLETARHPVLEDTLRAQGRAVVPMTLAMSDAETVLVISGPNTGGKTVALKTVGLAVLAAQSSVPVAAQSARLGIFDRVLADIGDEQSIAADLSTFSAHVLNLKSMLASLTEQSLVLVDEMGTGTAPEEGAALAVALLDAFRVRRCLVLATTHHDRLKAYASVTPGVLNASVEFDEVRLAPTYRLRVGVPGGSSGLDIAQRLGLSGEIVARARELITPEAREAAALIAYLHRSRDTLERMQRDLAAETRRLEDERRALREEWVARQKKRIAELEEKFNAALANHEKGIARAIENIHDREVRAQAEKSSRRRTLAVRGEAREEADAAIVTQLSESQADLGVAGESPRPPTMAELVPGAKVRLRAFPATVVLRRRDDSSAEVEAGPLRMKVPLGEIVSVVGEEKAKSGAAGQPKIGNVRVHAIDTSKPAAAVDELNVIGCTVEEASNRVDKFLDQAVLAGKEHVRIIHGYGTGALRRGLREFLGTHPLVGNIHAEVQERGGDAVTVAELKV